MRDKVFHIWAENKLMSNEDVTVGTVFDEAKKRGYDGHSYANDKVGQLLKKLEYERMFDTASDDTETVTPPSTNRKPIYDINELKKFCLTSEEFQKLSLPPRQKILDPWVINQFIILITANRGVGKTFFVLTLLIAISQNKPFGPWSVVESVPCLYYDAELVSQDMQSRLSETGNIGDQVSPLYILSDALLVESGKIPKGNLQSAEWRAVMKSLLLELDIKVWALDNIASATAGGTDENSVMDWRAINQWLLELRYAGITTILVHHTSKIGEQRGTHSREDNIDISVMLKRPKGYRLTDGAAFDAVFTKARLPNRDLLKISDVNFRLTQDTAGNSVWETNRSRQDRMIEILRFKDAGLSQIDIADDLGCSKQNVSATIKRAKAKGWLKENGKLSQSGREHVNGPFLESTHEGGG
jgi:hypothetical protein